LVSFGAAWRGLAQPQASLHQRLDADELLGRRIQRQDVGDGVLAVLKSREIVMTTRSVLESLTLEDKPQRILFLLKGLH